MTAAAYEAFGIREWPARLWPALTGFLGVIFAFYLGRRLFGPAGALLGAAVLASSLLYVLISHVITLDIGVSFFLFLAVGALFLAISVPWFVAVSRANPEFLNFFFVHEHFERFLTRVHGRYQPPWYFIAILSIGFLPWIVALFPALWNAWKSSDAQ